MNHDKTLFFAGIDWGSASHQVCVTDQIGSTLGEKAFNHTDKGLCEMAQWLIELSRSTADDIAVAIEVPHGPVVETLLERGFRVHSINPKQLDRFRDRFSPSGAKDDRRDARVLADALRTDGRRFRRLKHQDSDIVILRELLCTREDLVAERTRLINRWRQLLWSYYPQFNELIGDAVRPWLVELWELVPTPAAARRIRPSTIHKLLKRYRIRRVSAEEVLKVLRSKEISLREVTVSSRVGHVGSIIERMKVAERQLGKTEGLMNDAIKACASRQSGCEGRAGDIEILLSIPGVGMVVLATLLTEAWDPLKKRDCDSLRCLGGTAPVTKQSGETRYVTRRRAASRKLVDAIVHWAGIAVMHDPTSKAKYAALRKRGHGYYRALRSVGDRLLFVACKLLEKGELFDKNFKKTTDVIAA